MANGELCKTCGCQETTHSLDPAFTCERFESEVEHQDECPILDCYGDCAATIEAADWSAECAQRRLSHVWFLDGPNVIILDINT